MFARIFAAALAVAAPVVPAALFADEARVVEELTRADLAGTPNTVVIVARQTLKPGGHIPLHTHYGDEHAVILKGGVLTTDGGKEIMFKTGMAVVFPRGKVHGGLTNKTNADVVMHNVYIVDKDKPLVKLVK